MSPGTPGIDLKSKNKKLIFEKFMIFHNFEKSIYWYFVIGIWLLVFEADPIGRRLECLPKKGINSNFYYILKVFLLGPQGLLKMPRGAQGSKKIDGGKF